MKSHRQSGYTITEVSLFIGVSGLLFLMALLGTGNTIRSVRFTDSGRSLAAYMQKQYDDLINGVNPRDANLACSAGVVDPSPPTSQQPGASSCLFMGRLFVFTASNYQIEAYNIVGTQPATPVDYGQADAELVKQFQPRTVTNAALSTYDIPWQAYVSGVKRTTDNKATNAVALIRSPSSSRIIQYSFKTTETPITGLQTVVNNTTNNMNKTINICVKNADGFGSPAKLSIGDAPTQSAVQIAYESNDGECNGV